MANSNGKWWNYTLGIVDGCTHSGRPGCDYCWARGMAKRFWGNRPFCDVRTHPEKFQDLAKVNGSKDVFVTPMGDLFHKDVSIEFIRESLTWMVEHDQHIYIILTKRYERMFRFMKVHPHFARDHIVLGHSISTQKDANESLPLLRMTPARKRILSIEPVLEYIWLPAKGNPAFIDGIIVGCESGPKRRGVSADVFRNLLYQCQSFNIDYYLKQMDVGGKVVHGPELDGRVWDQLPWKKKE